MWTLCRLNMILLLIFLNLVVCFAVTPTTCVAPACVEGEPTFVTCYFNRYINATKHEILVKHRPVGSSKTVRGNVVLLCYWLLDSGKITCTPQEGYHLNGSVSDRLTVLIPSATKDSEGQYACHIVPPEDTDVHECELTVQERQGHPSSTLIPSTDSTPANDCNADYGEEHLIIMVGCLLAASIALNVCFLYRGQHLKRCHRAVFMKRRTTEDQDPECMSQMLPEDRVWPAQIIPDTGETATQTDDMDSLFKPVFALQTPDSSPRLNSPTTGNSLEKSALRKRIVKTEKQLVPDDAGLFHNKKRALTHPGSQNNPSD
ncbi:uncharacterized protein [Littorina saxatilis]|uniref:uncharacterized protein n=1 Tax=Littorina saxatilis TaxID=31220 RepID=UPI0038B598E1